MGKPGPSRWGRLGLLALMAAATAGCASQGSSSRAVAPQGPTGPAPTGPATTTGQATTGQATTVVARPPHFDTPEAAMTYLAAAWNANDLVSLRHVTNPAARAQLDAMHSEAVNLRLDHCEQRQGLGDYTCFFRHDYPAATPTTMAGGVGEAIFLVGPALAPGWYMTVFESCG